MAKIVSCSGDLVDKLADGWECSLVQPGTIASPMQFTGTETWIPARVPGTAAAALREAGKWNGALPLQLDDQDVWYRARFTGDGEETLRFEGLATIADVWLNRTYLFCSDNMFVPREAAVTTQGTNELYIRFGSLASWLRDQRGRARWRTRIASPPALRFARTTLLGRMPGWCPTVHPVGPWRPVERIRRLTRYGVARVGAHCLVVETSGRVELQVDLRGDVPTGMAAVVEMGGCIAHLDRTAQHRFSGVLRIPNVALWWPHTHGTPRRYQATLRLGEVVCDLGHFGFRQISVDHGEDGCGFAIQVNGVQIFCRGACWTTPDIVTLPGDAASYRPWLEEMRNAGMNMVRVGGTMVYEADDFFDLCDELGLLVWQDVMLANFDYPATQAFRASLTGEVSAFLHRTQSNASLAVLCGGSEVLQQATMLGVGAAEIDDTLYSEVIPEIVRGLRPDLPYVVNSPSGGDLPFLPDTGVAHYYGVGAYRRPMEDARRAGVRFASECLALSNVPCQRTVDPLRVCTTTDPCWKAAVPRDPGAGWDFEDVRDHYLEVLFGVSASRLRSEDFARYLDLSRAVSCILFEHIFGEWRRVGSTCHGGLVWQLQDVAPGAGWGVLDSHGRRKPAWYALQRAFRPRHLVMTDEGLNGLSVHIWNETDARMQGILRLTCLKDGAIKVREAERHVRVQPRGAMCLRSTSLLSTMFDITYAYRFGPPAHDVTVATLLDPVDDTVIADAYHFPTPGSLPRRDIGMEVALEQRDGGWWLDLQVRSFAQFLHINDSTFIPDQNWFHLPPGRTRSVAMHPECGAACAPAGEVCAINTDRVVRYGGRT